MLQVARLAPKLLGESADLVRSFLLSQLNADGGFRDRDGASDLYYTVFGIEGLVALRADLPAAQIAAYLRGFGDGEDLTSFTSPAWPAAGPDCLPAAQRGSGRRDPQPHRKLPHVRRRLCHADGRQPTGQRLRLLPGRGRVPGPRP